MKLKALLRAFPIMLVLALLGVGFVSAPVSAVGVITQNATPATGSPTMTQVSIAGNTFAVGPYQVLFGTTVVYIGSVPAGGALGASFVVPYLPKGVYNVTIDDSSADAPVFAGTFTVVPAVTVGPAAAPAGTLINVSCTGFGASVALNVTFGSLTSPVVSGSTDANGTFSALFIMPQIARYTYTLTARETVTTTNFATTLLAVTPRITTFSADTGGVGDSLIINGDGFTSFASVSIFFDSESTTALTTVTTSTAGVLPPTTITIPTAARGTHSIILRDDTSPTISATRNFTINQSRITLTPSSGQVGTTITITGTGFNATSSVDFEFDGAAFIGVTPITTTSVGSFSKTGVVIPTVAAGPHTIRAKVTSDTVVFGDATFTIAAKISPSATSGKTGDTVSVSGTGFSPNGQLTVTIDNTLLPTAPATIQIAANGTFNVQVTIPGLVEGAHTISATDGVGNVAIASFSTAITAGISPVTTSATAANIGQDITINGDGFKPAAAITIKLDNSSIASATSSTSGGFTATFKVPVKAGGAYKVNVSDGLTTREFDLFIETQAPAAPSLTSPATETKPKQPITFEWGAVTDPSAPVTYKLEVASDANFSTLVLTKNGLTTTSYAMTEAEKLETVSKKAPYYWRVTATDGAGNVSAPSAASTFTVGFSLSDIPVWAWVTIAFFAIVIIGGVVYLLMRRKAAF